MTNLLRISAVPAVFSVSSVFHQVYEVFHSRILNFNSNFKNPAYKFQISELNFWYRRRYFTALLTPRSHSKRKRTLSAPPVLVSPKKRLKWTNESMLAAIKAVQNGSSVSMAAVCHNVPRMTLQDRLSGRVVHGTKPGPVPYLNKIKDEEANLAEFLEVVSDVGYGKTKKQIKNMVESAACDKGVLRKDRISDGWFRGFMERQPQLRLRKGDKTSFVRMDAMKQKEELNNYFITLKSILVEHNLMNKLELIYNLGCHLNNSLPELWQGKGRKK